MTTPLPGHLGRLPEAVQEAMRVSVETGALGPADLDPSVIGALAALPEAAALICVKRFLAADLTDVGNKTGFLVGIIGRLRRETPAALAGGPAPVAIAAGHGDFNKTLWVGNLPSDVRVEQLRAVFGCIGVIRDLRLAQGGNIAFVEYEKAEDAAAARQLDGALLKGARLAVRRADPRRSDATEQSVARGAAVRATARVVAPLVPRERAAAVGGVAGPRQLAALAAVTSPAVLAALDAPAAAAPQPVAAATWGTRRRRSPGDDDDASRSRSRSPPRRTGHRGDNGIPCRFYNAPGGCRAGDACAFVHFRRERRRASPARRRSASPDRRRLPARRRSASPDRRRPWRRDDDDHRRPPPPRSRSPRRFRPPSRDRSRDYRPARSPPPRRRSPSPRWRDRGRSPPRGSPRRRRSPSPRRWRDDRGRPVYRRPGR